MHFNLRGMYNAIVRNDCHYDKSIWLQCKLTKYPKFCHMDFKATVPHLYKEHNICGKKWCSYKRNSDKYRSTISLSSLKPSWKHRGKHLWYQYLEIGSCELTKEAESFHSMLTNKAPKAKHLYPPIIRLTLSLSNVK